MKKLITICLAVLTVSSMVSATTIYDSSSMYEVGTTNPTATSGWNNDIVTHSTYAYLAQQTSEIGGKIGFAGSDRLAESATVQLLTGTPATTPNQAVAGDVTLTLSFYGINGDGSPGSLIGSKTQTFASPAGLDNVSTPYVNEGRPFYTATFELTTLNLTLPEQVYFGVALQDPGSTTTTQSTNLSLWCYGTYPGWSTSDSDFDASTVKVGTDLSNSVWGRDFLNGIDAYSGFTPNLTVTAVPEPMTLVLLGLGALALFRRKRRA